jgi:hypothetical protein
MKKYLILGSLLLLISCSKKIFIIKGIVQNENYLPIMDTEILLYKNGIRLSYTNMDTIINDSIHYWTPDTIIQNSIGSFKRYSIYRTDSIGEFVLFCHEKKSELRNMYLMFSKEGYQTKMIKIKRIKDPVILKTVKNDDHP